MSRSGYTEDYGFDNWTMIMWRGAVASAIKGRRGQAFLHELIEALDAMPEKRLIADDLRQESGEVCALGAIGARRGVNLESLDPEDHERLSSIFGVASAMIKEVEWENDEGSYNETPEQRWERMRRWAVESLSSAKPTASESSRDDH